MRRLLSLLAAVVASAAVVAAGVSGVAALSGGLVAHASSSQADPLPAITTTTQTGSTIYADDGTTVLAHLSGPEIRRPVPLSQVSKVLVTAVLDTEDKRFYLHGGFDIPSTLRALASDSSGSGLQGGSTITQQLVKQVYLSPARKLSRKIREAVLAGRLQQRYTKDQILQAYLNIVYLGQSAYGVQAAANVYFAEDVSKVTLPQAALLAGLIQDPSGHNPITDPSGARTRRGEVLARMVHYHDITQAEADAADAAPLPTSVSTQVSAGTGPTNDYVTQVVAQLLGPASPLGTTATQRKQALFEGGLRIVTNLDPTLEALATAKVVADTPRSGGGFQQALVSVDPANGAVRALVGGNSGQSFNVVTDGMRQPGSGFKLFTLVAALEAGHSPYDTVDATAPCAIAFPGNLGFVPINLGGVDPKAKPATNDEGPGSGGVVNLVQATAQSLNCGYLRLAHETGLGPVADWAKKMGITARLTDPVTGAYDPSMVLGAVTVHPLDMAAAYATVANGGTYHAPSFIDTVTDRTGSELYSGIDKGHRVLSEQIAGEASLALQAVLQPGGTAGLWGIGRPAAGKTGTTTGPTDAWFNGFTPQLETTVWMGSPSSTRSVYVYGQPVYGGTYPARTWNDFMANALRSQPPLPLPQANPALIPPAHYVTSPSLIKDDKSDHNFYGYGGPPRRGGPYGGGSRTGGAG